MRGSSKWGALTAVSHDTRHFPLLVAACSRCTTATHLRQLGEERHVPPAAVSEGVQDSRTRSCENRPAQCSPATAEHHGRDRERPGPP